MNAHVSGISRIKPLGPRRSTIVSVLDIGSIKTSCIIARLKPTEGEALRRRTHAIEVIGFAARRSRGVKSGVVVDLDGAEQTIRMVVDKAERMAGMTVTSLIVNVSCGRLQSEAFSASVSLDGHAACENDIRRVLAAGGAHSVRDGRVVVHSLPIGYGIDGAQGLQDPRGMMGSRLGVDMHIVTADAAPLSNLELAVNRAHLEVETMVATPYACGLAALTDDEAELGVSCVDLGGGATTVAVFQDGHLVHADAIAVGGHNVTLDIARGLSTGVEDAERLKTRHGSALPSISDEQEIVTIPALGEDDAAGPQAVPRATLTRIVRARVEEILEVARDRMAEAGFGREANRRIVLTGGASQLMGMTEAARRILGRNVRLGRPLGIAGLPQNARGPAFAASVGLLIYPQVARIEQFDSRRNWAPPAMTGTGGYFARVGQWLREGF